MDYKLAKQLKDAGFPQEGEGKTITTANPYLGEEDGYEVYVPTLSELIEACGEDCWFIERAREDSDAGWVASPRGEGFECSGQTPEEAVALLWLKLNDK